MGEQKPLAFDLRQLQVEDYVRGCTLELKKKNQAICRLVKIIFCIYDLSMERASVVVFNATLNNISVISWRSVLLVEETRVPGKNHRPVARH